MAQVFNQTIQEAKFLNYKSASDQPRNESVPLTFYGLKVTRIEPLYLQIGKFFFKLTTCTV
ncbi:MAG: hypothetical protein F6J89_10110 [Symploca sp. SIO1C4]|uniref:Uncharacterized protein n=1 Tax=Symploca sp. SIO1C4 TaxID=2607765 RepID=A0A6B3N8P3_9CYAN|nr:hypothetical protein [Symploca sp. SIO1C4]